MADVVSNEGSILNYFRKHAPSEAAPLGIAPEVLDNYIKSCGKFLFLMASVAWVLRLVVDHVHVVCS